MDGEGQYVLRAEVSEFHVLLKPSRNIAKWIQELPNNKIPHINEEMVLRKQLTVKIAT